MADDELAILGGTPIHAGPPPAWPPVTQGAVDAVARAVSAGVWGSVDGPLKVELERRFAAAHDCSHGVAVSNGTVSLQIALSSLGIGRGDEVIVPAYTFLATGTAVLNVNAAPVFVDVDPATATIDPEAVRAAITPRTAAIMPVHFGGQPADLDALTDLAAREGLAIIEDAAQAHGARWNDRAVGSFGAFGSFSFQASKNMSAGEGGFLTSSDAQLAERAWSLHHCGRTPGSAWYEHDRLGGNHRMTEFQAALLLEQLDRLDDDMDRRERGAAGLDAALRGVAGIEPLVRDARTTRHARHLYVFRHDPQAIGGLSRDAFVEALQAEGVPASGGYPTTVNQQPVFSDGRFDRAAIGIGSDPRFDYGRIDTPVSSALCREAVWLPQNVLLAGWTAPVAAAAEKIVRHAGKLNAALGAR